MNVAGIEQAHLIASEAELAAIRRVVDAQGDMTQGQCAEVEQCPLVVSGSPVSRGEAAQLPMALGVARKIKVKPVDQEFVPARRLVQPGQKIYFQAGLRD